MEVSEAKRLRALEEENRKLKHLLAEAELDKAAMKEIIFMSDQLASGRRFRVFNIVDDFSRACVAQVVDVSISGLRLTRELDRLS